MINASAGGVILSPTASINPSRTTTVPFVMVAPLIVTIFALLMATAVGGACANAPRQQNKRDVMSFFIETIG